MADARRVVLEADRLKAKAQSLSAGLEAELSLVVDVMFPHAQLTSALADFKLEFPSTPFRLHVEALGAVSQAVLDGRCSLGITGTLPFPPPTLATESLGSEPLITVTAPASRLAGLEQPIKLEDILDETQLVLTDRSALTHGTDYGVQAKNTWRLADLGAKHALLKAGLGWGHMPRWLVENDLAAGRLVAIDLEGPAAGIMPFKAIYPTNTLPGPAGRWILDHIKLVQIPT